jgi:hypothetical protein
LPRAAPPAVLGGCRRLPYTQREPKPKASILPDKPEIERLRGIQERREKHEDEEAERASEPAERKTHERRADKAAYLRDRLEEQAKTPDE